MLGEPRRCKHWRPKAEARNEPREPSRPGAFEVVFQAPQETRSPRTTLPRKPPGRSLDDTATANTAQKAPGRSTVRASLRSSSLAPLVPAVLASSGTDRAAGPFHSHPVGWTGRRFLAAGRAGASWRLDGPSDPRWSTICHVANGQVGRFLAAGRAERAPTRAVDHTPPQPIRSFAPAGAHSLIPRTSRPNTSLALGLGLRAPTAELAPDHALSFGSRTQLRITPPASGHVDHTDPFSIPHPNVFTLDRRTHASR